jgi:small subunit ribosomal protein S6
VITINKYELGLILDPAVEPERQAEILDRLRGTVEGGKGMVVNIDDWGKRKLAYEIKRMTEGLYVFVRFSADPKTLSEVERVLGITDDVMRFMTLRLDAQVSTPA